MKFRCEEARALVPSYLDGELEEERASPLRTHLLDCHGCREVAKEGKLLGHWFEAARAVMPPAAIPVGFAARTTRLAFAGSEPVVELRPEPPPMTGTGAPKRSLLPFLLTLTSLAAAILFVFAIMIQRQAVPTGASLEAGEGVIWVEHDSLDQEQPEAIREELDDEAER